MKGVEVRKLTAQPEFTEDKNNGRYVRKGQDHEEQLPRHVGRGILYTTTPLCVTNTGPLVKEVVCRADDLRRSSANLQSARLGKANTPFRNLSGVV